jgi:hypothetical protein
VISWSIGGFLRADMGNIQNSHTDVHGELATRQPRTSKQTVGEGFVWWRCKVHRSMLIMDAATVRSTATSWHWHASSSLP